MSCRLSLLAMGGTISTQPTAAGDVPGRVRATSPPRLARPNIVLRTRDVARLSSRAVTPLKARLRLLVEVSARLAPRDLFAVDSRLA